MDNRLNILSHMCVPHALCFGVFIPAVEVGFTQQIFIVTEGEESVEITINKTGQNSQIFDVAFTTEDGTAMCELVLAI